MKPGSIYKDVSPRGGGEVILIVSASTEFVWFLRSTGAIMSTDRLWFDYCMSRDTVVPFES